MSIYCTFLGLSFHPNLVQWGSVCVFAVYTLDEKMILCTCKDTVCYTVYSLDEKMILCTCKDTVCWAITENVISQSIWLSLEVTWA